MRAQEPHVVDAHRVPPDDRPDDPGHRVRVAAAVERGAGIVDVDAIERGSERVGVALAPDLAVSDDVQPGILLRPDGEQGRVPLRLLEVVRVHPPELRSPDPWREPPGQLRPVDQPVRLGVAADKRGGEEQGGLRSSGG